MEINVQSTKSSKHCSQCFIVDVDKSHTHTHKISGQYSVF